MVAHGSEIPLSDSFESPFLGKELESIKALFETPMEDSKTAASLDVFFRFADNKTGNWKNVL